MSEQMTEFTILKETFQMLGMRFVVMEDDNCNAKSLRLVTDDSSVTAIEFKFDDDEDFYRLEKK